MKRQSRVPSSRPRHVLQDPAKAEFPTAFAALGPVGPGSGTIILTRLLTLNSSVTLLNNQLDLCPSHSFRPLIIPQL
jgi:hypothetical protein